MDSLYIDTSGLLQISGKLKSMSAEMAQRVNDVLTSNAEAIALEAHELVPRNFGGLAGSIQPDVTKFLEKHIKVNANYAAYVEFGTGKYAAEYVPSLPTTWQDFAAKYKGQSGGGDFFSFVMAILDWIEKKGIKPTTATYSIKSRRRTGNTAQKKEQDYQMAAAIAYNILHNGIHPHPFLYPAYEKQRPLIIKDVENALNAL